MMANGLIASEDCLYLDVHVPVEVWNNRNKPASKSETGHRLNSPTNHVASLVFKPAVLVFIHGGGYAAQLP